VPLLAIVGTLARKLLMPAAAGTLPTYGTLFVALLVGTIVIVGGITFFSARAIGSLAEQVTMRAGVAYWVTKNKLVQGCDTGHAAPAEAGAHPSGAQQAARCPGLRTDGPSPA
jgi:Potassium-transporting ATPase A subunit